MENPSAGADVTTGTCLDETKPNVQSRYSSVWVNDALLFNLVNDPTEQVNVRPIPFLALF